MSSGAQENSTNNQHEHPLDSTLVAQTYPRDPAYYFEDASTVLLVGGVLFKVQLSLLMPDPKPENYDFDSCIKYLLGDPNTQLSSRGATDADAVPIPNVSARQFRHLLLALLGRPGTPEYAALFTDAQNPDRHTQEVFVRYLDIGTLARRFKIDSLGSWAQSQLRLLFKSPRPLSSNTWNKDTLLEILAFGKLWDTQFTAETETFVRFILMPSISSHLPTPNSVNIDTCASLYKDPRLAKNNHGFYGWLIAVILSRRHISAVWLNQLSRDDRLVLYALQAELMEDVQGSGYIFAAALLRTLQRSLKVTSCSACSPHISAAQKSAFGPLGDLRSGAPLDHIKHLAELPYYSQVFAETIGSPTWSCDSKCWESALVKTDELLEKIFRALNEAHESLTSNPHWQFASRSSVP